MVQLTTSSAVFPRVRLTRQPRLPHAAVGHTVTSGAKFNKKDKATWWAIQLGEQKVHVVAAALSLVGDRQMQLLLNEAEVLHATEQAASLGGAFMKVMKDVEIDGTTLYDHAKQISGERELERVRERQRMRVRSRNGKNLY